MLRGLLGFHLNFVMATEEENAMKINRGTLIEALLRMDKELRYDELNKRIKFSLRYLQELLLS